MYFYKNSMSLFCPRLQPSDNFVVSCDDDFGSNNEFETNNEDREIYKSYSTVMQDANQFHTMYLMFHFKIRVNKWKILTIFIVVSAISKY